VNAKFVMAMKRLQKETGHVTRNVTVVQKWAIAAKELKHKYDRKKR
jgi:hypothetical protein